MVFLQPYCTVEVTFLDCMIQLCSYKLHLSFDLRLRVVHLSIPVDQCCQELNNRLPLCFLKGDLGGVISLRIRDIPGDIFCASTFCESRIYSTSK